MLRPFRVAAKMYFADNLVASGLGFLGRKVGGQIAFLNEPQPVHGAVVAFLAQFNINAGVAEIDKVPHGDIFHEKQ